MSFLIQHYHLMTHYRELGIATILCALFHLILESTLRKKYYYLYHFTDEEIETQRLNRDSETQAITPLLNNGEGFEPRFA